MKKQKQVATFKLVLPSRNVDRRRLVSKLGAVSFEKTDSKSPARLIPLPTQQPM